MRYIKDFNQYLEVGECINCGNSPVIFRRHSGQKLCKECFRKSIEKIVNKTISRYHLLNPSDKVIVALSGGKDSIALLYNLINLQKRKYQAKPPVAITIDEGIDEYRIKSINLAKDFSQKYDIEHHIVSFKERIGKSLDEIISIKSKMVGYRYACNYCATIRRRILNEYAKDLGGSVLALGHNLTDLAETFLMNVLQKRMYLISNQYLFKEEPELLRKYYIKKITPLMKIPEEEIYIYDNIVELKFFKSHCPYREIDPILRRRVLEFIDRCKEFTPEIEYNLFNAFEEVSKAFYEQHMSQELNFCQTCGYPTGNTSQCSYCDLKKEFI